MRKLFVLLISIVVLSACAPVHRFTQLRKLPREYSENYSIEGIKAPRSAAHRKPWIVYSDRVENAAYVNPGGRVKSAEVGLLDTFLVIKTKGELYDFLRKKDAITFIHHDNPYLMNISQGLNLISYGTEDDLYVNGRITGNSPYLAFEWKAGKDGEAHQVCTQLIGEYNFPNALAAITIGRFFGVEAKKIDKALAEYTPQNNRSQLKKTEDNTLIIDAYNANPTSMMAALQNFRNMTVPHKMLILGDMRELGADSPAEHQKIVDYIKESDFEKVWLVGEQFAASEHSFKTYANVQEVIKDLQENKPKGYTILIKGSNGIKLSSTVEFL